MGKSVATMEGQNVREILEGLNVRERLFLDAYIENGGNGKQAYLKVRPEVEASTAATEATETLKKPHVLLALQTLLASATSKESIIGWFNSKRFSAKREEVAFRSNEALAKMQGLMDSGGSKSGATVAVNITMPTTGTIRTRDAIIDIVAEKQDIQEGNYTEVSQEKG